MKIKLNGQTKTIPERWEEVPFDKFVALSEAGIDETEVLSILFDIPETEVRAAKIEGLEKIIWALKFLQKPFEIEKQPKSLDGVEFPKNIEFETVEQYQECLTEVRRVSGLPPTEQLRSIPLYAAIYLTKPYDTEKAQFKAQQLMKLPCTEVMAAGLFFQTKSLSLQSGLPMSYLQRHLPMKKNRLASVRYLKRLASTKLWILWRVMWSKMTKLFSNGQSVGSTPN